jgi:SAM-dependent methyltransferase
LLRVRREGFGWLALRAWDRISHPQPAFVRDALAAVKEQRALEIGGPSAVFARGGMLPVYPCVAHVDNVNFASETAWESRLREGSEFRFDASRPPGRQFLREATELTGLADGSYDTVLSSHCLEHVANPLAALREWRRVVRPGGHLLLALPDPRHTFDCRRPITSFDHLREDYERHTAEHDLTHVEEILALHDLSRDLHAGSREQFAARARLNPANRCLHHHVFDLPLMRAILTETGWTALALESVRPLHLVAFARRAEPALAGSH